jgi:hypothetical protein
MSIKRHCVDVGKGTGGHSRSLARAVEAGGWLFVSGQVLLLR